MVPLPRESLAVDVRYDALFDGSAPATPVDDRSVAELLRCSMGLSAWKQYRESRWALRVNPSSGNLHPTEAYVVRAGEVYHYAAREHALEHRATLSARAWAAYAQDPGGFLVALTSIHWREAWKYGERAFRYCQHDAGHAVGALRLAAAMLGWNLALLSRWSDADIAAVIGTERDADFIDAEREEPELVAVITPGEVRPWAAAAPAVLVAAGREARWAGRANRLSPQHVEWPIIDDVARETRNPGVEAAAPAARTANAPHDTRNAEPRASKAGPETRPPEHRTAITARRIILQRRSALGFDARSSLPRGSFLAMLRRTLPRTPPWDAIDWPPQIHLLIFVHRIEGLTPGLYAYPRDRAVADEWRGSMRPEFLWEPVSDSNDSNGTSLFLLVPTDVTWVANRLSCDQDIAADGFFSLGMIARAQSTLRARGDWFYRRLFWESGMVGQVLYLEAEAAGARATGIGCFYDDPVHDMAGLSGHEWQSVYHFSMGMPVDDGRLTTEPGYDWEK